MSVNWSWKHKMGVITLKQKSLHDPKKINSYKINLYSANCLAALIYEFKDPETGKDMYNFYTYFNDLDHLKRCIGLKPLLRYNYELKKNIKETDNIFKKEDEWWAKIKLNTYYSDMLKMADCLAQAGFKVELYYKKPKEDK